jgi:2-methylcitrate dehydratase PrpD
MENNTTQTLASFVSRTRFEDLPREAIHETKRLLLDVIGCALGSVSLDKGRIAVEFARESGGRPQATILGTGERVTPALAAFANGELMNAMDYCPLLPPNHIPPFVAPAPLALAEAKRASGKTLITAVALANEVASRVGLSLDSLRGKERGVAPTWGLGFNEFGATAGAAKVLNLDGAAMADALGLAGYLAPVPSHNKFLLTPRGGGLAKYGPAGWTAQGGVTSALLASKGYEGDRSVLDGESGFWAMTGSTTTDPSKITLGLGQEWNLLRVTYKRWPCCGLFQSPLGAFTKLVEKHQLSAQEIESVLIKNEEQNLLPRFRSNDIRHHVDVQSSLPYNIALAAYRVDIGPGWQSDSNLNNPVFRAFMGKVSVEPYARADETRVQELMVERRRMIERRPSYVQVTARGQVFTEMAEYAHWLSIENADFRATDEDLAGKFRANAANTLGAAKVERAIDKVMNLEAVADVTQLMEELVP